MHDNVGVTTLVDCQWRDGAATNVFPSLAAGEQCTFKFILMSFKLHWQENKQTDGDSKDKLNDTIIHKSYICVCFLFLLIPAIVETQAWPAASIPTFDNIISKFIFNVSFCILWLRYTTNQIYGIYWIGSCSQLASTSANSCCHERTPAERLRVSTTVYWVDCEAPSSLHPLAFIISLDVIGTRPTRMLLDR